MCLIQTGRIVAGGAFRKIPAARMHSMGVTTM